MDKLKKAERMYERVFTPSWKNESYMLWLAAHFALLCEDMMRKKGDGKYSVISFYDQCANYKTLFFEIKNGKVFLTKCIEVTRRGCLGEFTSRYPWEQKMLKAVGELLSGDYDKAVNTIYGPIFSQEGKTKIIKEVENVFND